MSYLTNTNDLLSDDVIAESDEHIRQITGGPQASMMTFENPEAFGQTVSIAPAEGQKPLSIMTDAEMISTIAKQYGVYYTDEIEAQRSNWLRANRVTAARHFQYRLKTFFQEFLKCTANPFGEIVDYMAFALSSKLEAHHMHIV